MSINQESKFKEYKRDPRLNRAYNEDIPEWTQIKQQEEERKAAYARKAAQAQAQSQVQPLNEDI